MNTHTATVVAGSLRMVSGRPRWSARNAWLVLLMSLIVVGIPSASCVKGKSKTTTEAARQPAKRRTAVSKFVDVEAGADDGSADSGTSASRPVSGIVSDGHLSESEGAGDFVVWVGRRFGVVAEGACGMLTFASACADYGAGDGLLLLSGGGQATGESKEPSSGVLTCQLTC